MALPIMKVDRAVRMQLTADLLWAVLFLVPAASAQNSSVTKFQSEHKPVTIERFDPKIAGLHAAVMVIHGGGGPEGDWRKGGILDGLTTAGYVAFVPHYFEGSGGKWEPSGGADQLFAYLRTLNDAARFVAQQPGVQRDGIGLLGFSLGGYVVLGLAEEEGSHPPREPSPGIKAVVEMYGGLPEFAASRMTTMPSVLILHGEDDDVVSVNEAYALEKLLKSKSVPYEIKIYPHQKHGFEGTAAEDANQRAVSFLKAHLQ